MSVVVPVYNEGENVVATLRGVIERAHTRPLEVLVVHDFDEDTTVPVVERLQSELPELRLHRNTLGRGVLNALKSGLAAARAPYVLVTMGDGSDDPGEIDAMYALANSGADVVAGSRYMRGGHQLGGPLLKRSMSRVAGLSLHWLGGLPIHDATSNYRMYSKRLLQRVTIESRGGFELGIELTVKAYALGMQVAEVPTTWRDRTAGQSRFRLWKWLPRYLRWYWVGIGARFKRTAS
ncbi:MAG: glycosyl transferase family 2 [Chloroflexi bacterium 13_1_40CM_3_65_12]|nr:MAG: glycosyl transferase family 2 [Chloroflexi bacterium 13_1_40CM_3_65_12]OLD50361.1 MAG: glycosyl transferase family 2 [Actinobacteria bacterium 13_1_40CM_2_65_8]